MQMLMLGIFKTIDEWERYLFVSYWSSNQVECLLQLLGAAAQFPSLPYNPDENGDGLIGVTDLQCRWEDETTSNGGNIISWSNSSINSY